MFISKLGCLTITYIIVAVLFVSAQLVFLQDADAASVVRLGSSEQQTDHDKSRLKVKALARQQDPTRPPSIFVQQLESELERKPEFQLTAIFIRNNKQYAVVNGTVLKAGDALDDMLVSEITPHNLTLQHAQHAKQIKVLELHGAISVKKQVVK